MNMNRKYIKTLSACIAVLACMAFTVEAATFYPLPIQESAANGGANYGASFDASDFVGFAPATNTLTTTTNGSTARVMVPIAAYSTVQFVGAKLITPFTRSSVNTNYAQTLTVSVGDGNSASKYISSWTISTGATYRSVGPIETTSITTTTTNMAFLVAGGTTNTQTVVLTATATPTVGGTTSYTVATNLTLTFTQNAEEKVTTNTIGSAVTYWRILK